MRLERVPSSPDFDRKRLRDRYSYEQTNAIVSMNTNMNSSPCVSWTMTVMMVPNSSATLDPILFPFLFHEERNSGIAPYGMTPANADQTKQMTQATCIQAQPSPTTADPPHSQSVYTISALSPTTFTATISPRLRKKVGGKQVKDVPPSTA